MSKRGLEVDFGQNGPVLRWDCDWEDVYMFVLEEFNAFRYPDGSRSSLSRVHPSALPATRSGGLFQWGLPQR